MWDYEKMVADVRSLAAKIGNEDALSMTDDEIIRYFVEPVIRDINLIMRERQKEEDNE